MTVQQTRQDKVLTTPRFRSLVSFQGVDEGTVAF